MPAQVMDYRSLSAQKLVLECIQTGEAGAWEEFIRRYNPVIAGTVHNKARRWCDQYLDICQDLVQDFYLKLQEDDRRVLRAMIRIEEEKYFAFLKVSAAHMVEDHFKGQNAQKRGAGQASESLTDLEPVLPSQGFGSVAEMDWELLMRQIERCLAAIKASEQEQQMFWLYYLQGLTAMAIAALPAMKLNVKGVESALKRVSMRVRECLEGREGFSAGGSSS